MNENSPTPHKKSPWLRRVSITVIAFALILGASVAMRLALAESVIRSLLTQKGLAGVELRVTKLNTRMLQIEGLRIGPELHLNTLTVSYHLSGLIAEQIDTVMLSGIKLDIPDMNSGLIATIRRQAQEKPSSSTQPLAILPHIIVRDAIVQARVADGTISAHLAGEIQPDGTASVELLSSNLITPNLIPLALSGQAKFDGQRINADVSAKPVDKDSQIDLHAIFNIESKHATFKVAPLTFARAGLQPSDLVPTLVNFGTVAGKLSAEGKVALTPENPVVIINLNVSGARFQNGGLGIEQGAGKVRVELEVGKSPLNLGFQNGRASIKVGGRELRLKGLQAQALLDMETLNLDATVKKARIEHPSITPVTFQANVRRKSSRFDFEVHEDNRRFSVTGRHDLTKNKGHAKLRVGPLSFVPGHFQLKDISPLLTVVTEARGGIGIQADLNWDHGEFDGQTKIAFDALTLKTDTLAIEGLNGDVTLDHLRPLSMGSVQTLVAKRIGGLVGLANPRLEFQLKEDRLFISHAEGEIAGGKVSLEDQFIDAQKSDHTVNLAFSNLDLARLFGMMNIEGVSGKGQLNGMVPIGISADMVAINGGNFKAIDPGILRLRSEAARNALSGAGQDAALLLDVLDDFHYQTLSFDIDKEGRGEAIVKLSTAGSNPSVMDNQPFVLNINLSTNLDKVLAVLGTAVNLSQKVLRDTVKSFQ